VRSSPLRLISVFLSPLASAQDAKLVADAKKEGKVVDMDELDTAGFAEKRKEYRKIFFQ
jgi:hypothetical protein